MQPFKMIITPKSWYGEVFLPRNIPANKCRGVIALNYHFTISSEIRDLDNEHQWLPRSQKRDRQAISLMPPMKYSCPKFNTESNPAF